MRKLLIVLLLSSLGCSQGQRTPPPELANMLVHVSATYLRHVVNTDKAKLGNSLLWHDFLQKNEMDKKDYVQKLKILRKHFSSPESHPLLGLTLQKLDWEENSASLFFKKARVENSPTIQIDLFWGSNSWLVIDDNLFGAGELIDIWTKK